MEREIARIVAEELQKPVSDIGVIRGHNCTLILVREDEKGLLAQTWVALHEEIEVKLSTHLGIVRIIEGAQLS